MTVKDIVEQVEVLFGRQSHKYIFRLINDGLLDISGKAQYYSAIAKTDLTSYQRWYDLDDDAVLDIFRVELLDTNDRYTLIPKLTDPHKMLKGDTDTSAGSKT
jgi:hypothetical protein